MATIAPEVAKLPTARLHVFCLDWKKSWILCFGTQIRWYINSKIFKRILHHRQKCLDVKVLQTVFSRDFWVAGCQIKVASIRQTSTERVQPPRGCRCNVAPSEVYKICKNRKTVIKAITEQYISRYLLSILKQWIKDTADFDSHK